MVRGLPFLNPQFFMGIKKMETVIYIYQVIAIIGFVLLPFVAYVLWTTTEKTTFTIFIVFFALLCGFVSIIGFGGLL